MASSTVDIWISAIFLSLETKEVVRSEDRDQRDRGQVYLLEELEGLHRPSRVGEEQPQVLLRHVLPAKTPHSGERQTPPTRWQCSLRGRGR